MQKNPAPGRVFPRVFSIGRTICSGGGANFAASRALLEEQGLADHRRHICRLEWLGDQEGRLRTLASEEALRISRDEDHRYLERLKKIVHRVKAGAAVRQLDIRQDETGAMGRRELHSFRACPGNAG